jgi:hypothetical protein
MFAETAATRLNRAHRVYRVYSDGSRTVIAGADIISSYADTNAPHISRGFYRIVSPELATFEAVTNSAPENPPPNPVPSLRRQAAFAATIRPHHESALISLLPAKFRNCTATQRFGETLENRPKSVP